jgi:hypothetical protein
MWMAKQFVDVSFPEQYPQQEVAEHEVLLSFFNDDDATNFRIWWELQGSYKFAQWLEKNSVKATSE